MESERIVVNHSGVAIGTVTGDGEVYDQGRVHIGSADDDGTVVDFAGVRIGAVRGAGSTQPAGASG